MRIIGIWEQHESNDNNNYNSNGRRSSSSSNSGYKNSMNQRKPKEYITKKKNKSQLGNSANKRIVLGYVALVNNSVNDIVLFLLTTYCCFFFIQHIVVFFSYHILSFLTLFRSFHGISHGMPPFRTPFNYGTRPCWFWIFEWKIIIVLACTRTHVLLLFFSLPAAK